MRTSSRSIPDASARLLAAVQSGRFAKMDYDEQQELYNAAAYESPENLENIKPAEERYSKEQMDALAYYHSSLFDDINRNLRRGGDGGRYVKILDGMFDHKLKEPVIVYRGTETAPVRGADKAFQSTSLSAAKSSAFTNDSKHLHAYLIPAGTPVIYIGGSEEEIILPRGFNLYKYRIK